VILQAQGDLGGAMTLLLEVERLCRDTGNKDKLLASLGNQGVILRSQGDLDRAMARHKEEEGLCRELGNKDGLGVSLGNQALILHDRKDLAGAATLLKEQEQLCRESGNKQGLSVSLGLQALMRRDQGDYDGAMALYKEEERLCRELGNIPGLAFSLGNQAVILTQLQGGAAQALALADEAAKLAADRGLTALSQQMTPVLDFVRGQCQEAARNDWALRYYKYTQDLAAWQALPLLKRLRTKKPDASKY
jgi:tetratricopeptide (TPR) repeat protein